MNVYRVMVVVPNDILGGAELYLKNISEYYLERECTVDIFFLKEKSTGAWEDLRNEKCELYYTHNHKEYGGIFGILKNLLPVKRVYDVIFTSHLHINAYVDFLRRIGLVRSSFHVARESTSIFLRFYGWRRILHKIQYSFFYKNIDMIICQSDLMKMQLIEQIPKLQKKVIVIPNPVHQSFKDMDSKDPFNPGYRYIVSAGRLIPEKGFDILITSFAKLKLKFPLFKLIILGEGEQRRELELQISELCLGNDVLLPGFMDDVYPYFKGAKVCVVPSRIEGFPNVLLQMMSQNDKVVSTTCAGGIEEMQGVITCDPNDPEGLYLAISKSLNSDSSINRQYFDNELESRSIDRFAQRVDSFLRK